MLENVILRKAAGMAVTGIVGTVVNNKLAAKYVKHDLKKNETREKPETFEKQMNKYSGVMAAGEAVVLGATYVVGKLL